MEEEQGPKISLVEIILMLMIVVPFDALEAVTALISPIPIIGQIALVVMHFGDWIVLFIIQFWLIMKGLKGLWALSGNLLEFIPYVDILPLRTLGLIATIILANRPEVAKIVQVAGAATGKTGVAGGAGKIEK